MKMLKNILLFAGAACLGASSAIAAETWAYDSANPENNIKSGDYRPSVEDLTIDVTSGSLTVTGLFENKGSNTVIVGGNTSSAQSSNFFALNTELGNYMQNHGILTFENVNLNMKSLFNENEGSVLYIKGSVFVNSATNDTIETKNGGVMQIESGSSFTSKSSFSIGDKGTLIFKNATSGMLDSQWAFTAKANSRISFELSNASLSAKDSSSAIMKTMFAKSLEGVIELDLSNFVLDGDFVAGQEYTIALVYNSSDQSAVGEFDDTWAVDELNVTNGEFAEFVGYVKDDHNLYVTVRAIPEPAAFAALFGAVAAALAIYRRKA